MSYGIPSSLNYNLIPSSIGEEMSSAISFPTTGNGKYYSANQDFFIVNVPKTSHNAVFDPINSFLCFKLTMPASVTANTAGCIQGECETIFQRVEVFCGSDLLETINNYDQMTLILLIVN